MSRKHITRKIFAHHFFFTMSLSVGSSFYISSIFTTSFLLLRLIVLKHGEIMRKLMKSSPYLTKTENAKARDCLSAAEERIFSRQNAKSTRSARCGKTFALFVRFHVDCTTKSLTLQIYQNPVHWLVSRVHHYHIFTSALSH